MILVRTVRLKLALAIPTATPLTLVKEKIDIYPLADKTINFLSK